MRFLPICLALLGSLFSGIGCSHEPEVAPNIILIMADDLGYGDLSSYGSSRIRTPEIDRLAAEGLRLTDYHSNGPVCTPTRAALLTGRYQQRAGLEGVIYVWHRMNRQMGMDTLEWTLAEALKGQGYATGITGKWHLGYQEKFNPVQHGFDWFRGYVSGNIDYQNHFDRAGILDWWENDSVRDDPGYSTHLITQHSIEFIEQHAGQPFFLYVAHEAPHDPYQGPDDPAIRAAGQQMPEPDDSAYITRAYREMVAEMDRGIGAMRETVERLGLAEQTLIIFCSDNGATPRGSNGAFRGHKTQLWEGGHRVPAILWWPGTLPAGTRDQLILAMDWMPTLLGVAGVRQPAPRPLDGIDVFNALREDQPLPEREAFWAYRGWQAMRQGNWKYVIRPVPEDTAQHYLFDLAADPGEQHNLLEKHPQRGEHMRAVVRDWYQRVNEGATPQPREKLKDPYGRNFGEE